MINCVGFEQELMADLIGIRTVSIVNWNFCPEIDLLICSLAMRGASPK